MVSGFSWFQNRETSEKKKGWLFDCAKKREKKCRLPSNRNRQSFPSLPATFYTHHQPNQSTSSLEHLYRTLVCTHRSDHYRSSTSTVASRQLLHSDPPSWNSFSSGLSSYSTVLIDRSKYHSSFANLSCFKTNQPTNQPQTHYSLAFHTSSKRAREWIVHLIISYNRSCSVLPTAPFRFFPTLRILLVSSITIPGPRRLAIRTQSVHHNRRIRRIAPTSTPALTRSPDSRQIFYRGTRPSSSFF